MISCVILVTATSLILLTCEPYGHREKDTDAICVKKKKRQRVSTLLRQHISRNATDRTGCKETSLYGQCLESSHLSNWTDVPHHNSTISSLRKGNSASFSQQCNRVLHAAQMLIHHYESQRLFISVNVTETLFNEWASGIKIPFFRSSKTWQELHT